MNPTATTVEQFVEALRRRDLAAVLALYAPDATWEVHVPGGDGLQHGPAEIADLMDPWFTGRAGFTIARHRLVSADSTWALQWELHWLDAVDGTPCTCHQSHFFEVRDGLIARHWLYCAGVRVEAATDALAAAGSASGS
jgi:ketosteroid isomerase-like protein